MSEASATGTAAGRLSGTAAGRPTSGAAHWLARSVVTAPERISAPDLRRRLQLALGALWLLDGVLQYQSVMFTRAFAQMLGASAQGNPTVVADPISWSAGLIGQHPVATNAIFATIQLLLGLGIAWRPTLRLALAASIAWSLAVWWLGEGLGGILTGAASPVSGAPGAVLIYALLAVLLWPSRADRSAPFVAGRCTGVATARLIWLGLWGGLAYLALQPAARAPQALSTMISQMAAGQPRWLAAVDSYLGAQLRNQGATAAAILAVALLVVAVGVYLPRPAARCTVSLAIVLTGAIGIAEGLGGILTGGGTDPNTGPLLALLALAYWPAARPSPAGAGRDTASGG